jgi:hypothetical protein
LSLQQLYQIEFSIDPILYLPMRSQFAIIWYFRLLLLLLSLAVVVESLHLFEKHTCP